MQEAVPRDSKKANADNQISKLLSQCCVKQKRNPGTHLFGLTNHKIFWSQQPVFVLRISGVKKLKKKKNAKRSGAQEQEAVPRLPKKTNADDQISKFSHCGVKLKQILEYP